MKVRVLGIVFMGAVAAAIASASMVQGVKIVWAPKEGTETKFKVKSVGKLTSPMEGEFAFTADMTTKTTKVSADEITQVSTTSPPVIEFNGMPIDAGMPEIKSTTRSKPNGEVIETKNEPAEADQGGDRQSVAQTFIFPGAEVKEGETWKHTVKKNEDRKVFNTEFTFTYVGKETVGGVEVYKITAEFKETDAPTNMTGTNTFWVEVANGNLFKVESKVKNLELMEGVVAPEVTTTVTRAS
jgi:hypothetical protein